MPLHYEALLHLFLIFVYFGVIIFVIANIISFYNKGMRSIGIITLFNKKRRDMMSNIKKSIYSEPKNWQIDIRDYESNWNEVDIKSQSKDINVIFDENVISTDTRSSRSEPKKNSFINLTLIERLRLKSYYRFLKRWYKHEHENESIDKFYIASTGFDEL